jgi:hypothetical protein
VKEKSFINLLLLESVMRRIVNKRGDIMQQYMIQIILSAFLIVLFLMATAQKVDGRGVKRQVLEKQFALFIDSAAPGMKFSINRLSTNGNINRVRVEGGRIFVDIDGLLSLKGYPYFSKYSVSVVEHSDKFVIEVRE